VDHLESALLKKYSETKTPTLCGGFKAMVHRNQKGEEHMVISRSLDDLDTVSSPTLYGFTQRASQVKF
jgi:hypothetical protein